MDNLMMQGMGPMMTGTWFNPQTNDKFTVRDSYFENDQYVVLTTDGRTLNYNQIQNYVQADKQTNESEKSSSLPKEVLDLVGEVDENMLADDAALIQGASMGNIYNSSVGQMEERLNAQSVTSKNIENYKIIEKALKNKYQPTIKVSIDWEKFPKKEILLLMDVMDIDLDEITEWYFNNCEFTDLTKAVQTSIKDSVLEFMVDKESIDLKKEEPVKKAGKKSKK